MSKQTDVQLANQRGSKLLDNDQLSALVLFFQWEFFLHDLPLPPKICHLAHLTT